MKKKFFFFTLLLMPVYFFGQSKDLQKQIEEAKKKMAQLQSSPQYKEAMQKAKQAMEKLKSDSGVQNQINEANAKLNSIKKTNPALSNVQVPDLDKMPTPKMPDFSSMTKRLDNASHKLETYSQTMNQTIPKQNISHHAEKLDKLSNTELMALATSITKNVESKLNRLQLDQLDKMLKDTSINIAGTGAFMLASGASTNAALFLICKGILKKPGDLWAINDLGVYYRDEKDYEKALQCYIYANALDTADNTAINTNIGWASAYYGDFGTANKYFDNALVVNKDFQSANEGKAMVAYAKGDIAALFQCLTKEIKYMGMSSGNAGPSAPFANICGSVSTQQNAGNLDHQTTDPTTDHTFDNPETNPGNAPPTPPGADVDDVTYTRYKKVFVARPEDIGKAIAEVNRQDIESVKEMKTRLTQLTQQVKTLKPLGQKPYVDEEGYLIYPSSFERYVNLLPAIEESYDKRLAWFQQKLEKKLEPLGKDVATRDADMMHLYEKELEACPIIKDKYGGETTDSNCVKAVECKWYPKMYNSKNNDLDMVAKMWDDYYAQIAKSIQWYLDATAPLISRVHEEGWNSYLNAYREYKVRVGIIRAYGMWQDCLGKIATSVCAFVKLTTPSCPPLHVRAVNPPDPFSKKPKHIKEFEGPCYDQNYPLFIGGGIESTCHGDKFYIGGGPFKVFYSHTTDQIAATNQGFSNQVGLDVSVSKDLDIVKVGDEEEGKTLVSASAGVEGSANLNFDNDWSFTGGNSSVSASTSIGDMNIISIKASRTVEMVSGQLNINPLSVTTSSDLK